MAPFRCLTHVPRTRVRNSTLALVVALRLSSVASAQSALPGVVSPAMSARNASYSIDERLDPATRTIPGSEVVAWHNITTKTVDDLRFHIYWNAWRNDRSTWLREAVLG